VKTFNHNNKRLKRCLFGITLGMFFLYAESEALRSTAERRETSKRFRNVFFHSRLRNRFVVIRRQTNCFGACGRGRGSPSGDVELQADLTVRNGGLRKSSEGKEGFAEVKLSSVTLHHTPSACCIHFETAKVLGSLCSYSTVSKVEERPGVHRINPGELLAISRSDEGS